MIANARNTLTWQGKVSNVQSKILLKQSSDNKMGKIIEVRFR